MMQVKLDGCLMLIKTLVLGLVIGLVSMPSVTIAEENSADEGGFSASLLTSYRYDDNILRDSSNIIDANIFVLSPQLNWLIDTGKSQFSLGFRNETAKYEGFSEDNYSDNNLTFDANMELSSKHRLGLNAALSDLHQGRGEGFNIGRGAENAEVDKYSSTEVGVLYSFGREATAAQLDLYYNSTEIDFDARLDNLGEDLTRNRDRSDANYGARFYYELTAKTDMVVDISHTEFDYDLQTGLGNSVDAMLVGVRWQASAKTSGRALFGSQDRERVTGEASDDSIWQIAVDWSPLSYSTISLSSSKSSQASVGIGNSRNVSSTEINWNHEWSSQWASNLIYTQEDTDYIGTLVNTDSTSLGIDVTYAFSRNLFLSFNYTNTDRDSNDLESRFNYDQELMALNFTLIYE